MRDPIPEGEEFPFAERTPNSASVLEGNAAKPEFWIRSVFDLTKEKHVKQLLQASSNMLREVSNKNKGESM